MQSPEGNENFAGHHVKKPRNLVDESKVLIQGSEFKAGMYLYSLLVDARGGTMTNKNIFARTKINQKLMKY